MLAFWLNLPPSALRGIWPNVYNGIVNTAFSKLESHSPS